MMNAFTNEFRANGFTQLYFLAAIVTVVIFAFSGPAAWSSVVTANAIIFGALGALRALFVPRERRIAAMFAWLLAGVIFVPVLLYSWYATRPDVSVWFVLVPPSAALIAFVPALFFGLFRRRA